ncbi:P60-like protein [Hyphopichia burtonii NRRL Y-1933]|uniref:Ribosome biogenesis protein NOP53 n=1 Tax=Hyphopichia burtonii NRRL Y-1933 TaxID=984485 RepID=A0A1E4RSE2_9ASCO|nr:P60-like protein [Hyphopichia burtonii NRRL Y-1933]ODV70158.1 P60-like protein [Hyphopichia burtonii NRRL Y-1933]
MEVNRPQQSQNSRKGKKAWRKNVNIDDIQQGLEESRERQILLGDDSNDFIIDDEGDLNLNKQAKKLKSNEILTNKSKIPALENGKNNKIQGVNKNKVHKLMKLSGRLQNESALKARVDKDGIIKAASKDPWAQEKTEDSTPKILKKSAIHERTKPTHAPKTLSYKSIELDIPQDPVIESGKSYNPTIESWKSLINKEFNLENEKYLKELKIQEYQAKIQEIIENSNENEIMEDSTDSNESEAEEDGKEENYKLSVNQPNQIKIKTKSQRNKQKRNKQRLDLESKLADLKHQLADLNKLEDYNKEVDSKKPVPKLKKTKKLFKHNLIEKPLEVKLSDELTDNLRNVKTEGNLLYDQMFNLQKSGKIESRVPVSRKRKYGKKITEKWTYKDFK